MSKSIGFILLIFFVLVIGNILINAGMYLLHSNNFSYAAELPSPNTVSHNFTGSDFVQTIHVSLFTKDGSEISYVTQGYGRTPYSSIYPNDWHDGIDIAASYGTPIYSPNNGVVLAVGNQDNYCYHRAFGKYIAVRDPQNNLILWYGHLGTQVVAPGDVITKGTELGTIGQTGDETGPHLHFSIFQGSGFTMTVRDGCGPEPTGQDLDPLDYLGTTYN
jgi:murein DD-endopeptidase MepM/ murein hydrolase activator NlpD